MCIKLSMIYDMPWMLVCDKYVKYVTSLWICTSLSSHMKYDECMLHEIKKERWLAYGPSTHHVICSERGTTWISGISCMCVTSGIHFPTHLESGPRGTQVRPVWVPLLGSTLPYLGHVDYVESRYALYEHHLWDPHFPPRWPAVQYSTVYDIWPTGLYTWYQGDTEAVTAMIMWSMYIEHMFWHVYVFPIYYFILSLHDEIRLIFTLYVRDFPHWVATQINR